jgi:hypothetical protein
MAQVNKTFRILVSQPSLKAKRDALQLKERHRLRERYLRIAISFRPFN